MTKNTTQVKVPTLGESVTEATVVGLHKKIGDSVLVDEAVCELETEKVTMEVPSPISGTIVSIDVKLGDDVEIGSLLFGVQLDKNIKATNNAEQKNEQKKSSLTSGKVEKAEKAISPSAVQSQVQETTFEGSSVGSSLTPAVSPSARLEADSQNVDLKSVNPTGGLGNITKADVVSSEGGAVDTPRPLRDGGDGVAGLLKRDGLSSHFENSRPSPTMGEKKVPMSKLRRVISRRLKEAQNTAAILTTFNEVDMTNLMHLRAKHKEKFEQAHSTKLGFMSFFVKAAVEGLKQLPTVNSEIYENDIIYKSYFDIGIAVGTPQGLVVPILRDTENMSIGQIESAVADFGIRAKRGKLSIDEISGGTFTITNGGVFGSMLSTPIINPPQSAILGLHKIEKRPVVIDDEIVIRKMMYLALSYDHRIIDGREAVTFLVRIKEFIENPESLLLG